MPLLSSWAWVSEGPVGSKPRNTLQIGALRRRQYPSLETGASSRDLGGSYHGGESRHSAPAGGAFQQNGEEKAEPSTPREESSSSPPARDGSEQSAEPEMQTPPGTPISHSHSVFEDVRIQVLNSLQTFLTFLGVSSV